MIVEAAGKARGAGGEIVAAEHRRIARRAIAAAIGAAPHSPALLEGRRLHGSRLEYRGISERDVVRQFLALGRKSERRSAGATDAAAAIDEGIEHQAEELALHLEADLLRAGCGFAGKLREHVTETGAREIEDRKEIGRQRATAVEENIQRGGDVLLILAQPRALAENGGEGLRPRWRGVARGCAGVGGGACRRFRPSSG